MEDEDHFKFADDIVVDSSKKLYFYDEGGEYISGDGTDLNLVSGADINIPANIGLTFGNDGEKIEGDGTDLTIAGNNINLTATADVVIPANVGITFGTGEKIEGDSTDLTITSGAKINLTATSDIVVPADVGITFGTGEKIEGDSTDLTITSGAKINLTATSDVVIPSGVGLILDGSGNEKIESDGTDITVSVGSGGDINVGSAIGITFGDDGEKIEGDGTDLTIASSGVLNLAAGGTTNQIKVTDGAILPITDDDVDLGSASYQFKNGYFDGTLEADAITVGGTSVLTGGAATAITSILNTSLVIGRDADNDIDFATDNTLLFRASGADQIKLVDGVLSPVADDDIDLGSSSLQFKDAYIDGTLEADAITIGGTAIGSIYGVIAGSSSIVTTGALDSGSITSGFGAIDNGTSGIRTNTFTAETSIIPDASGGADLGSTSAEWGDFYIADDKYINFGSDQNILVGYDETTTDSFKIAATEGAGLAITLMADEGDDAGDEWKLNVADGGTITLGNDINSAGTYVTHLTLTPNSTVTSSLANFAGEVQMVTLDIGGTNVSSTATELNLMDGGTSAGTTAVASGDGIVTNDGGTMRQTTLDTFDTYLSASTKTLTNKTLTAPEFADAGYIADASGNELIILQTTGSAVNQFDIHNAATGNNPIIEATGGDSNVGLNFTTKGTGLITFNDLAYYPQQALTSSSNAVAWDAQAKPNAYHLTTENTTFSAPSNATEGAFISLELNFDGSHTIGWNTIFEFAASTEPTETATNAKTDIHIFRYNGSVWQEVGRTMNLSES